MVQFVPKYKDKYSVKTSFRVDIVSEVISSDSDSHIFKAIKLPTKKIFTICFPLLTFITFLLVSFQKCKYEFIRKKK